MACNRPWTIKTDRGAFLVPCGWCMQCRIDKRNEWEMRLAFEVQKSQGFFLTLTYDDLHLPKDLGLHKEDLQKFFKRFRKNVKIKLKYYAVGEYGEQGNVITGLQRPHYHAIVCGINALHALPLVQKSWTFGFVKCLPAQHGSIRYVLKYMDKQIHGFEANVIKYGDKQPPFALMSKGIGLDWICQNQDTVDSLNGVPYNGRLRPVPRYYKSHFGFNDVGFSPSKKIKLQEYMAEHDCTLEKALNDMGKVNELHLLGAERTHSK